MNQHCQRNMTNTPCLPMKLLWLSEGPPGSFQTSPLGPWQAGHKPQELAVSIVGNVLGNIAETCVLCHVKKIGFHEKFLGIVPFGCLEPCKKIFVPRNFLQCSQELVQKFPGAVPGNIFSCSQVALFKQDRGWDLFFFSEKYEFEIMNEYGL